MTLLFNTLPGGSCLRRHLLIQSPCASRSLKAHTSSTYSPALSQKRTFLTFHSKQLLDTPQMSSLNWKFLIRSLNSSNFSSDENSASFQQQLYHDLRIVNRKCDATHFAFILQYQFSVCLIVQQQSPDRLVTTIRR